MTRRTGTEANNANPSSPDAELEARVVAWSRQARRPRTRPPRSNRLAATNPVVREFQREMAAVQGLVAEGMRAETAPLRLPTGRREKLWRR